MSVVAMLQGNGETDRATTSAGVILAQKLGLPLTGLCALPDPEAAVMVVAPPESSGMIASSVQSIIEMQQEVLAKAQEAFESVASQHPGLEAVFVHEMSSVERAGANAATLSEALVYPHSAAKSGHPLNLSFDYVLMNARLPVFLNGTLPLTDGPAVIAWDGSNGAARAVRLHLQTIKAYGKVIIAQNADDLKADPKRENADPAILQDWLSRRGVTSEVKHIEGEVASGLLALVQGSGASMIVSGAYGHSRISEAIFGGTTRRMLAADEAPAMALCR